ncbi:TetR family transcriptional regulator [Roseibacterium sp. SDUM158016]|uniref:TetR/AcrR family transcriptional regulator n=1 Tax=Roseicyclus sediminis TaxID=2980997 RepID=UPI0021D291FF|nr:TetR/AcrR family transcriptional regulator [Roseibacterium sp. SDUM158016]MCU4653133.1 TetR family transcriptional regulator [Roseibacterium sp. SDUM158016]
MSRLDKSDWLDFALAQLAENGHGALKAQTLAAGLGVTRGSFYWHFEDLAAFKRDLVAHWMDRTTEELVRAVVRDGDAEAQLRGLMRRALRSGAALERAMRAWATVDAEVAQTVAAVDWRRIRFAEQLLAALGVSEAEIGPRSRMLYWAAIGRLMMMRSEGQELSDAEIEDLAALLSR